MSKELKSIYDYVPKNDWCQWVAVDNDHFGTLAEFAARPDLISGSWLLVHNVLSTDVTDRGYAFTEEPVHVSKLSCNKANPLPNSEADEIVERMIANRQHDPIDRPQHYQLIDGIEAIQVIRASMTDEQFKGYCLGNVLKYRLRAGKKDDPIQDLNKADKYQELYNKMK